MRSLRIQTFNVYFTRVYSFGSYGSRSLPLTESIQRISIILKKQKQRVFKSHQDGTNEKKRQCLVDKYGFICCKIKATEGFLSHPFANP
jgi:hypothetical protein